MGKLRDRAGCIRSKVIVELAGKPKEYIETTLKEYVEQMKKSDDIEVLTADFEEAEELKGEDKGMFLAFVDIELLAKDLPALTGFCFDYMPSSIEIIEPTELRIKDREFTQIMNDLQGKLHKLDMAVKHLNNENKVLARNTYLLATNFVFNLLIRGVNTLENLAKCCGMPDKDMKEFLEKLEKEGKIKKEEGHYTWIKDAKREE